MDIDIDLFMRMLSIDSTSSKERGFADFLEKEFGSGKCTVSRFEVGDGTVNLLLSWGHPGIGQLTRSCCTDWMSRDRLWMTLQGSL